MSDTPTHLVDQIVLRCEQNQYYGKVQLVFRRGELVHIELGQTIKPEDLAKGEFTPVVFKPGS